MENLITPQAAADFLGVPVSTLYVWRSNGNGPASLKIGRRLMYSRSDLESFVSACRTEPAPRPVIDR